VGLEEDSEGLTELYAPAAQPPMCPASERRLGQQHQKKPANGGTIFFRTGRHDPWEEFAMPAHDWTRVRSYQFHDFHQSWTIAICNAFNAGQLPPGYYAMVAQKSGGPDPDFITFELTPQAGLEPGGLDVYSEPPKTRFVTRAEAAGYAKKANRITVRHPDGGP
jgi:hypothetical protein